MASTDRVPDVPGLAAALAKIAYARTLLDEGLRELGPHPTSAVATAAPSPMAALLDVNEAASIFGVSPGALRKRIERGVIGRAHGLIHRPGRPIEFHRETLLAKLTSEARR